ncbi:hypothetical protein [Synechocystis sp. PCC 7509]|uniref:hypothetical protein n=1 Tax=Synechocystis sp. PCC 7509 TaxID=927677 RepID=UPI0002ABA16C|nr:hypothetical protein [Synechocystis sp. PCC 7509]
MNEGISNIFNSGTSKKLEISTNKKVIKAMFNTAFTPEPNLLLPVIAKGSSWQVTFKGA